MLRSNKAQSTLEYIIIFTAIVGAVLIASSYVKGKVTSSLNHTADQLESAANKIDFTK